MKIDEYITQEMALYYDQSFTHSYTPIRIGYLKCLETIKQSIDDGYIDVWKVINMTKYTITIDVESSYDLKEMVKKIERLDRIETFMIKYHKVEKVEKFNSSPYYDIVSDYVNETPNNIKV